MKRKQVEELKSKNIADLEKEVAERRTRLRTMTFDLYAGKIKNVRDIREEKKAIARALTFIRQQQSQGNS